jgi:nitrilase
MQIAALQMVSTPDVDRNLATAGRLIAEAASAGARLVALPEYFCLMGHSDRDKLAHAEAAGDGPVQSMLAAAAQRHGVWVIGGTLPIRTGDPARAFNSNTVWAPDGTLAARYDKMHLFAFEQGEERYDEGRVLQAGGAPVALQAGPLRVGLSVCYDLRFPELYRALAARGVRFLAVPAAFARETGRDHWEVLLRARAIENQAFVLAAAQVGEHGGGRASYGRSMIIDPWGLVLARAPDAPGPVFAECRLDEQDRIRAALPVLRHRKV